MVSSEISPGNNDRARNIRHRRDTKQWFRSKNLESPLACINSEYSNLWWYCRCRRHSHAKYPSTLDQRAISSLIFEEFFFIGRRQFAWWLTKICSLPNENLLVSHRKCFRCHFPLIRFSKTSLQKHRFKSIALQIPSCFWPFNVSHGHSSPSPSHSRHQFAPVYLSPSFSRSVFGKSTVNFYWQKQ